MCVRAHMCAQTMIEDETRADTVPQHRATNHIAAKSLQSCPTLSDPMDCSPPGSSIHGIFQARVLEWGAIAFSTNRISSHLCHVTCVADTVLNYFHEHYFI